MRISFKSSRSSESFGTTPSPTARFRFTMSNKDLALAAEDGADGPTKPSPSSVPLPGTTVTAADANKATEDEAGMQLLNALLGAGIVGFPFCFRSCGMILATILVLTTVAAAEFGMQLLVLSSHITGRSTYQELAHYSFGAIGTALVDTCVTVMNMGGLVAYLNMVTDTFSLVAGTIVPPGAEPSRPALLSAITLCAALPLALFVRSPRVLSTVSQASVGFLLLFAGVLVFMGMGPGATAISALSLWRWDGVLVAFPLVTYGFTAHQVLFSVYASMRSPTAKKMTGVVSWTMGMAASVYFAVGVFGYRAFGARTAGDVLRNMNGGGLQRLIKVGYGLSLLASIPLLVLPLQSTFAPAVGSALKWLGMAAAPAPAASKGDPASHNINELRDGMQNSIVTAGVLATACTVALLLPNVEYVFGLAGSTASVLISFVLPAAIFLQTSEAQRTLSVPPLTIPPTAPRWLQRRRAAAILLAFGVVSGVACTSALLATIQEEAEVVQLAQELAHEETKAAKAVAAKKSAESAAEAAGAMNQALKRLEETRQGAGHAVVAAERAATKAADEAPNKSADHRHKAAAKDLKPALRAAEKVVASLEDSADALDAALDQAEEIRKQKEEAGQLGWGEQSKARLAALRAASQESLQAAEESRAALVAGMRSDGDEENGLEAQLKNVVAAASEALRKVDETMEALRAAEAEQTSQVFSKLVELRTEEEATEAKLAQKAAAEKKLREAESSAAKRKRDSEEEEEDADVGNEEEDEEEEDRLTAEEEAVALDDALSAGSVVNVTKVAQVAAVTAGDVVHSAKAAAEEAVGKAKRADVAVRAIEIAKELTGGAKDQQLPQNASTADSTEGTKGAVEKNGRKSDDEPSSGSAAATLPAALSQDSLLGNLTAVVELAANRTAVESDTKERSRRVKLTSDADSAAAPWRKRGSALLEESKRRRRKRKSRRRELAANKRQ